MRRAALHLLLALLPVSAVVLTVRQEIRVAQEREGNPPLVQDVGKLPEELPPGYDQTLLFERWQKVSPGRYHTRKVEILAIEPDGSGFRHVTRDAEDFHPAWSPGRQRIAVAREGIGILAMKPDGGDVEQLSWGESWRHPQWLGEDLLLMVGRPRTSGGSGLYLQERGRDAEPVEVDLGGVLVEHILVSPDRRGVVLIGKRVEDDAFHGEGWSLYMAETADLTGTLRPLPTLGEPGAFPPRPTAWTPDSRHVVVPNPAKSGRPRCLALDRQGEVAAGILPETVYLSCRLAFSPDGRQIAYRSGSSIWLMDRDGGNMRHLLRPRSSNTYGGLAWGPDPVGHPPWRPLEPPPIDLPDAPPPRGSSGTIVFEWWRAPAESSDRFPPRELWAVQPDGTGLRQLTGGHLDGGTAASPDGRRIAFFRSLDGAGVRVSELDGTGLISLPVSGMYPQWLTDDTLLVNGVLRKGEGYGRRGLWVYSLRREVLTEIDPGDPDMFKPLVSPDRRRIAFRAKDGESTRIVVADVDDVAGTRREWADGGFLAAWAPDGRSLVLTSGRSTCRRVSLEGELLEQIFGIDECNLSFSPDGEQIVFQWQRQIWVMDRDGANRRRLAEPQAEGEMLRSPVWVAGR